ncbi:pseudouridine synthase [Candidatus Electronema sp. PJ]|uniref:pseudouridine synthase n=1 Tax=Candidatus Electronema sp. PJ TaxID=3401572 RepID=UPI003AA80B21
MERLQKIIAQAGICSRRRAEQLIVAGRVTVDGQIVTELGSKIDPAQAVITVDGKLLRREEKKICLLLNKPRGYVTTLSDPQGRPIVTDLLPPDMKVRLFPVGRLDLDSEGALLMTNDGELANKILHPKFEVNKTYEATVRDLPKESELRRLAQGIIVDGQKTWPAQVRVLRQEQDRTTVVEIVIHEGKKRQVRKMFQAVGHPVLRLKRTAYGGLRLGEQGLGSCRFLGENDLAKIFS